MGHVKLYTEIFKEKNQTNHLSDHKYINHPPLSPLLIVLEKNNRT